MALDIASCEQAFARIRFLDVQPGDHSLMRTNFYLQLEGKKESECVRIKKPSPVFEKI